MKKRQIELLDRILNALDTAQSSLSGPELAEILHVPVQAIEAITIFGVSSSKLFLVDGKLVSLGGMRAIWQVLHEKLGDESFPPKDFREAAGLSRTQADHLAICLETAGYLVKEEGGWRFEDFDS